MSVEIIKWPEDLTHNGWLDLRRSVSGKGLPFVRIGASEVPIITGSSKWSSKRRLFLEKADIYSKDFNSDAMVLGHFNESTIKAYWEGYVPDDYEATLFNSLHGIKLREVEKSRFFVLNSKYDTMFASLDFTATVPYYSPLTGRLVEGLVPHEVKFISNMAYREWDGGISQAYTEQLNVQLLMSETEFGIFLPLIKDAAGTFEGFRPMEIEADSQLQEYIVEEVGKFCLDVTKAKLINEQIRANNDEGEIHELKLMLEELIPIDGFDDTVDVQKETHIGNIDELRLQEKDDSEAGELLQKYVDLQQSEKAVKYDLNETKAKLFNIASGFEGIQTESFTATIRGNNSTKGSYFKVTQRKK